MADVHLRLTAGQTAVVGYGSLTSRPSIERTLKRPYGGFFGAVHVDGWRRTWDAAMPNQAFFFRDGGTAVYPPHILYLNVRRHPETRLNAMLFVCEAAELAAMHGREWIYEPTVVTAQLRDVTIEGGDAIMYVARPDYARPLPAAPAEAAIRASYVRLVEQALDVAGAAFRDEFARTSEPVPRHLIVSDELDPGRPDPWAQAGAGYRTAAS